MSNTSSSAFNAHSPPYIRRHAKGQRGGHDRSTGDNLDMEDIYDNAGRKSASEFRGNQPGQGQSGTHHGIQTYGQSLLRSGGADNPAIMSQDSSSQLQISQDSILRQSQQQRMMMQ